MLQFLLELTVPLFFQRQETFLNTFYDLLVTILEKTKDTTSARNGRDERPT